MLCMHCSVQQEIAQCCSNCKRQLARYYCSVCKFHDDDPTKEIYHCKDCNVCRIGKQEQFFHCQKCDTCLLVGLRDKHVCRENIFKSNCPICDEYLFSSTQEVSLMPCQHAIHSECLKAYMLRFYICPLCSKSLCNQFHRWQQMDELVRNQPMPSEFQDSMVEILCNDCDKRAFVAFHFVGHKCPDCHGYNTRVLKPYLAGRRSPPVDAAIMHKSAAVKTPVTAWNKLVDAAISQIFNKFSSIPLSWVSEGFYM